MGIDETTGKCVNCENDMNLTNCLECKKTSDGAECLKCI